MLTDIYNKQFDLDEAGAMFNQSLKEVLDMTSVPARALNPNDDPNEQMAQQIFKRPSNYADLDSDDEDDGIAIGEKIVYK